jgi:6-phosphogluconolactonase
VFISGYSSSITASSISNQGTLQTLSTSTGPSAPSFLAFHPSLNILYALDENKNTVSSYSINNVTGSLSFINQVSSGGQGPAYVSAHKNGRLVFAANYGNGNLGVINIDSTGKLGAVTTVIAGAHAHMAVVDPSGKYLFVPCLGANNVSQFVILDNGTVVRNAIGAMATPSGSGPRHLEFHPSKDIAYLINEVGSTVMTLAFNPSAGTFSIIQTLSNIPSNFTNTNTGAEIHVTPNGRYVYASNRGHNSLAIYSVQSDGTLQSLGWETGGNSINTPRDFTIDATGKFILVANQNANTVTGFSINQDGSLTKLYNNMVNVTQPSFVGEWISPTIQTTYASSYNSATGTSPITTSPITTTSSPASSTGIILQFAFLLLVFVLLM